MLNTEDEASIALTFDYLDSKDDAVVQIVHDGPERTRFRLVGTLKGNCSISRSESPAYRIERTLPPLPMLRELLRSSLFGWFGGLTYFAIGIAALVAPFKGASWWWLFLAAFGFLATWVMIYAYAIGQVPSHFQRELGSLPMANKAIDSDKE